jgi:hypothetical protein
MRSRFSSAAKVALEKEHSPAALERLKTKKLKPAMVDRKIHTLCHKSNN